MCTLYFKRACLDASALLTEKKVKATRLNLDELVEEAEELVRSFRSHTFTFSVGIYQEKSGEERSDAGSQAAESDYDVEEEYDNDYAENYFDNGEGDDLDDIGGGGGDEGGGGEIRYFFSVTHSITVSRLRLAYSYRA